MSHHRYLQVDPDTSLRSITNNLGRKSMFSVDKRFDRSYVRVVHLLLIAIQISILITGCAQWFGFPAYFDATTYKNLTDLKPQIQMLYDTFTQNEIDEKRIESIRLKLAQMYEYEKGKGERNKETMLQIGIIQNMFERHIGDRIESGTWTELHAGNLKENISEAFDIAISTENLKNKNE